MAETVEHQACERLVFAFWHLEAGCVFDLVVVQRGGHHGRTLRLDAGHERGRLVVLVVDLADDLLEDILERDDACRAAMLVDDHGELVAPLAQIDEELIEFARLRHRQRWCHEIDDCGAPSVIDCDPVHRLHMDDTNDVVEVVTLDRKPAVPGSSGERDQRLDRVGGVNGLNPNPRDHRVVSRFVGETDRTGKQLDLAFVEGALLPGRTDQVFEFAAVRDRLEFVGRLDTDPAGQLGGEAIEEGNERASENAIHLRGPSHRQRCLEWSCRGDCFGHQLTEDHLHEGCDHERNRNRDPRRHLTKNGLKTGLEDAGHGGLGEHTEQQRRDRDAELCSRQVVRQPAEQSLDGDRPRLTLPGSLVDPGSVDSHQGELRSHEPGVGDDERERGKQS